MISLSAASVFLLAGFLVLLRLVVVVFVILALFVSSLVAAGCFFALVSALGLGLGCGLGSALGLGFWA